jgi:hypothetical protein
MLRQHREPRSPQPRDPAPLVRNKIHNAASVRLLSCVDFGSASAYVLSNYSHDDHEDLAKRARRAAAGKHDSINCGWLAIERLYDDATDALPGADVGLSVNRDPETWVNIARLAEAIVTACDQVEARTPSS